VDEQDRRPLTDLLDAHVDIVALEMQPTLDGLDPDGRPQPPLGIPVCAFIHSRRLRSHPG
jgi:hypothetical protein